MGVDCSSPTAIDPCGPIAQGVGRNRGERMQGEVPACSPPDCSLGVRLQQAGVETEPETVTKQRL